MLAVWGMVTRGTRSAGIQGPSHAIDVATALRLYTISGARLNHEADRLGSITPGKRVDTVRAYALVGYRPDRDFRYIQINQRLRELYPQVVAEVVEGRDGDRDFVAHAAHFDDYARRVLRQKSP